jgi:hypothetical protein
MMACFAELSGLSYYEHRLILIHAPITLTVSLPAIHRVSSLRTLPCKRLKLTLLQKKKKKGRDIHIFFP